MMSYLDRIFEKYRHKWVREDEDVDAITISIVQNLDRNNCLTILKELEEEELQSLIAIVLREKIKDRLSIDSDIYPTTSSSGLLH
ncbi:DUF6154 family protein [Sutcliffiella cohnii]|nr:MULTISPECIES: DUF6154 family protein [Sutcliffiella]MED4016078.1 DUF6154 family protein [Sutcliffiella cohnii]WBL14218.1 DUF6154 family protein [Sutcliffiella sp. NC1]